MKSLKQTFKEYAVYTALGLLLLAVACGSLVPTNDAPADNPGAPVGDTSGVVVDVDPVVPVGDIAVPIVDSGDTSSGGDIPADDSGLVTGGGDDPVVDDTSNHPADDTTVGEEEGLLSHEFGMLSPPYTEDVNGNPVTFIKVSPEELQDKYGAVLGKVLRDRHDGTYRVVLSEVLSYTPLPFQVFVIDGLADIAREDGLRSEVLSGHEEYTNDPWEVMAELGYGDEERDIVEQYNQFFYHSSPR